MDASFFLQLSNFFPSFKVLPYWGTQQDRKVLRQSFHPKKIYASDPSFNVTITSYQLLIQDETYLKRVKWQYMILDEAQVSCLKADNPMLSLTTPTDEQRQPGHAHKVMSRPQDLFDCPMIPGDKEQCFCKMENSFGIQLPQ